MEDQSLVEKRQDNQLEDELHGPNRPVIEVVFEAIESEEESSDSAFDLDGKPMHPPRRFEDYKDNMDAYFDHPTNFRDYMSRKDYRWMAENSRVVVKDPNQKPPTAKSFYRPPRGEAESGSCKGCNAQSAGHSGQSSEWEGANWAYPSHAFGSEQKP